MHQNYPEAEAYPIQASFTLLDAPKSGETQKWCLHIFMWLYVHY